MRHSQQILSIISLIFIYTCSAETECSRDLSSIYHDLVRNLTSLSVLDPLSNMTMNFLVYSGRTINDFGEYQTCENQEQNHYITMYFDAKLGNATAPVMFGLCLPRSCSAEEAKANTSQIIGIFFRGMGIPINKISDVNKINFYDPQSSEPIVTSNIVCYIVIIATAMLTVAGTILNCKREYSHKTRAPVSEANKLLAANEEGNGDENSNKPELRGFSKFVDCFDAKKNFERLIKVKYTDSYDYNLEIFNGIRVLMFGYVVYGHTYLFGTSYVDNLVELKFITATWWYLVVFGALFAVDVFFWLGGFLLAYIAISKLEKMRASAKNYFSLAFHRLFRIWPTYAIAILFFWKVLPYMGSGPVWFTMVDFTRYCNDGNVYANLLLIDDFTVEKAAYCFGWGWYLSNDFQMFLLAPFFLWYYIKNRHRGKIAIACLIFASITYAILFGYHIGIMANPPSTGGVAPSRGFTDYYIKPWVRLPPFYIGILMGIIYREYKEKYGVSYRFGEACKKTSTKWFIQLTGFGLMMFIIFYIRQIQFNAYNWSMWFQALWRGLQKPGYVLALSMLIWPSLLGEDTLMKRFLSHPIFVPLARLGFTGYLVHLFWVCRSFGILTSALHFTDENILYFSLSNIFQSLAGGLVLSIAIEVPLANIEQVYITKRSGSRGKKPEKAAVKTEEYTPPKTLESTSFISDRSDALSDARTSVSEHKSPTIKNNKSYTQIVDV